MNFTFKAKIYKIGINACVRVPIRITKKMMPIKGYIPIKGTLNGHSFQQTLVPIKNVGYRLYVNGPMLKGSRSITGDRVEFNIEMDDAPRTVGSYPIPRTLKTMLKKHALNFTFTNLNPSRRKEILRYLNSLKTEEALARNIAKVVTTLKTLRTIDP